MMDIKHNTADRAFYIELNATNQAHIKYRLNGRHHVDFYSTYVPPPFRGQGYAAALVDHALQWAQQQSLNIQATCHYVNSRLS